MRGFILVCVCLALTGAVARARAESDAQAAQRLRGEIADMIGDARCRNIVNCRVIGLGYRPCGGFEEYVAYSIWRTQREDLEVKATTYNFLREEVVRGADKAGACEVLREPNAACINSHCVIAPADH